MAIGVDEPELRRVDGEGNGGRGPGGQMHLLKIEELLDDHWGVGVSDRRDGRSVGPDERKNHLVGGVLASGVRDIYGVRGRVGRGAEQRPGGRRGRVPVEREGGVCEAEAASVAAAQRSVKPSKSKTQG